MKNDIFAEKMRIVAIRNICLAQIASDAGKRKKSTHLHWMAAARLKEADTARDRAYTMKDTYILRAKQAITACRQCGISFGELLADDQRGNPSIITYFRIKTEEETMQISFHTPLNKYKGVAPRKWRGEVQRWQKEQDSRTNCEKLIKKYFP